jgi:HK97 family phage prohead protease
METDIQIKASNGQVSVDEVQGIVECFVAAIGNKDSVGDIIQPGAFAGSLQRRKPRVVWGHNWNDPIGKVLDIQEVGPSDPRLPEKMKSGGVGGLYARVQFNLGSEKGREAFANIAFYGEEQEWSIGYKTINATFDPVRQANILHEVELYECSPVLHGANQLTGTISVKGAEAAVLERTNTPGDDLEFAFDDLYEKGGMLAMMPVETPRAENMSDQHDRKLELELQSRSPQPIKLISSAEGSAIFQVQRSDNGTAMYRVHFHYHPERGFMLGQPERVVPQMMYAPFKPPGVQAKPQVNPANRYEQSPADAVMPRIMRIVQKLDTDNSEKGGDQLVISCKLEDAFATKSLLDPIIDYHGAIAEVTEEGIIIKSGATPDFIEAVETATKALGRRLGRGLLRGGGGGSGKVRRAGRALRAFNPDARDADLDMLVQEGTPWERPALPRKPGPSRGFRSGRRLLQGRNWDERGDDEAGPDTPTPDARAEGVAMDERPPTKARMGELTRDEYEAFLNEQAQKIIKAYGIQDVSDPLYPHPALTEFDNFDHTELVPIDFFDDMPGNIGPAASNGWDEDAATRAGEMRSYELDAPIIMGKLDELTEDIRANGIKHPLVVQYDPETGTLALDEGNHRLAAAQRLGMKVLPVRMLRQPSAKRRSIRGPRKEIPTQTNGRGDLVTVGGELLGPSFKPSDIGVNTQSVTPEMRRLQMLVAARGGSSQQAARRRRRGALESTRNRSDFRAARVAPDREGGQRIQRGASRTPELAANESAVWNRAMEASQASRRAAELRGRGFNELEITSLMNPPSMRPAGLASRRNFHGQDSHQNLRDLIDAREAMLDFLTENPHFDETVDFTYDLETRTYPGLDDFPGGIKAWDSLMDDWEELRTEYGNILNGFREENQNLQEAREKVDKILGELADLDKDLDRNLRFIEELAPSRAANGEYLTTEVIKEFLLKNDYDGLRALFTPEYVLERHENRRGDPAGDFEDLEIDESEGVPYWEASLKYGWQTAKNTRGDIEEKEQEHYSAEESVSQHARNGQDVVLEAAEKIDKFDRNMNIEKRDDDSFVASPEDAERMAERLVYGQDLESSRMDATTGSLEGFSPKGTGFRSQRGAGLGEDFELDSSFSSAISHAHYNAGDEELAVTFKGGRTYIYGGIAPDIAAVVNAESSLGEAVNEWIKGRESYLIKPDGTVVDRMGFPSEAPTLGEKLKRHANRLRDNRGLNRTESETFKKAQKILDGTGTSPAKPVDRSRLVNELNQLADNLWSDGEPHAAGLLRDSAVAIRSDPRRRVNAHHGGRMEVSLSEEEIGEISDGLKSTRARYDGHPNIERGLSAYDKKLRDAKGGKVSLDSAEYNQILESYARLEAMDPDGYFKPGRDVLEMAAFSKKGKWVSPNVAKDTQFPDKPHGFASRRPNNGAPADITPRLQGDLVNWARQQSGFRVVQDLVRRYDRGGEQLSPRDWIRLHDYYANYSPAGRGMLQYGERRGGLRSSRKKPDMSPGGIKKRDEPVAMGPGQSRFFGRKWEELKPGNWDELSLQEQAEELMVNFNPRSNPNNPQLFDWPPPEERLRSVDYDHILGEISEQIETQEERANPGLAIARRRRERRQRIADAAKPVPTMQRRQARTQADSPISGEPQGYQPGLDNLDPGPGGRRRRLLDPEGGRDIGDDVGKPIRSPDEQAAMDRRLRIMDSLDVNIGTKRNALATASMDDRADESHVEFWDSLQDTLDADEDLTFDMIERMGIQIDDYLEDQTGRTLTPDEDRSITFANRLREHILTVREEYEDDKFIQRGDPFVEDVDDTARRWVGTEAAPEGDDAPDDPQGTARISREDDRFPPRRFEQESRSTGVSREAANAVRSDRDRKRRERALSGESGDAPEPKEPPEDGDEIEDLAGAFRSRRSRRNMDGVEWENRQKEREARRVAKEGRRIARETSKAKKKKSKREEKRRQQKEKDRQKHEERVAAWRALPKEEQLKRREEMDDAMGQMNPVRTPWGFSSRRDEGQFEDFSREDMEWARREVEMDYFKRAREARTRWENMDPDEREALRAASRETLAAAAANLAASNESWKINNPTPEDVARLAGDDYEIDAPAPIDPEALALGYDGNWVARNKNTGETWEAPQFETIAMVIARDRGEIDVDRTPDVSGGLPSRRTPAEDVARDEGISLEEAQEIVDNAQEEMDVRALRQEGEWNDIDSRARRLNPGHYANAPLTGTGQVWPPMSRQGSYDLMGGANYAGSEDFVGTLSDAIDQWMENRGGGPSGARTPLWGDGLEPDDPVIWTYASDDVDGDGIPLLTRSDVEAAFEARGIPSGGDLDETRNRDRIERGPEDTRSAQEIFDAEYTQGPTGEPGASSADFYPVDLDTLDEEVQDARAHYRAMVEEPEQDVISVEDQLGVGGEIESLHRTRPHELSDMSIDELNKIGAFWLEQPSAGSREHSPPGRSIRQELEVRDEVEKLRADFEGSDRQRMISLRDTLSGEFGIGFTSRDLRRRFRRYSLLPQEFNDAVIVFRALSRLAEEGALDGVPGLSEDGEDVPDFKTQVKEFGENLYRGIGPPPGMERGSPEATIALFGRGRYLKENHLQQILDYPSPQTAALQDWKTTAWQMLAFRELARREARDFDLNIPKEQRSQFDRSLRARAALAPEPMGKEELVVLAMRRLRLAEEERDEARLGQRFGVGLMGAVSDRHYLDDIEGRPRSESPTPLFAEGDEISKEDLLEVFEGPLVRRPDEELHARAMETPEERRAGRRTAEKEADERLDELISSIEESTAPRNLFEEVPGRDTPAAFKPEPGARRADAFMSRRDSGFASHRDMSKQRAARNPKDRSLIKQSSPFFKIIYDSLGVEIKKERDPVKRKALEKLKRSFEYFNSSSIRYGPDNPFQTSDGELQIDNDAIPDITDALFDVLGRWTRKSTVSEIDRKQALIDYLEAIDEVGGRTHPEVESMMPLRIAAVEKFLQKLVERGMDLL